MKYAVVIERAPHNYAAYVPDLPGCVSTGATEDEALRRIHEAIAFHLDGMREDVLGKAVAKFECAEFLHYIRMHRWQVQLKHCFFAELDDVLIHLAGDFGDDFFDAGGMNTAVLHQALH